MTIKAIRELNTLEPGIRERVLARFESLPNFSKMVRYSYGALSRMAKHQTEFWMKWGEQGLWEFRQRFTTEELNIIDAMGKTTRADRIQRMKQRCKSGTEKSSRYIADIRAVVEREMELQEQIDALQNERTRVGAPTV